MVQTNQMIAYLNTAPVQRADGSQTASRTDKKGSFSEALGQEMSQEGKQTTVRDTQNQVQEKPQQDTEQENPVSEQVLLTAIPWMLQPAATQQTAAVQQTTGEALLSAEDLSMQTLAGGKVAPVADGNGPAAFAEGQNVVELTGQTRLTEQQSADPFSVRQQTAETETTETTVLDGRQMPASERGKTSEAVQQQAAPVQQSSASTAEEIRPNANGAEMTLQSGQSAATQQIAFETPKTQQTQTVDMSNAKEGLQNLARTMADQMLQGKTEFEIWMEPVNLGKLAIKVAYESGRAMISILCMNEKTMEILSQHARNLGNILQENTGNNTVVVVEQPERDYLQQHAEEQNRGGSRQQDEDSDRSGSQQEAENQSFLEQLRLGLM